MRVLVWPADEWGCGHYRLLLPAWALQTEGADVTVDHGGPKALMLRPEGKYEPDREGRLPGQPGYVPPATHELAGLAVVPEADVVVMQRPVVRWWADIIPHIQAHGIKVVVDVDDRYDEIHPRNVNRFDPSVTHVTAEWVDRAVEHADVVTCTTPALAERYGCHKAVVLPNLVPASYLALPTERYRVERSVGWPGLPHHHPGDLAATEGGVAAALRRSGWHFRLPDGDGFSIAAAITELGLRRGDEMGGTSPVRFWDWSKLVAEIEVGIVPLAPSTFNQAKSALKASEMAAVGVPVVMSPTPDNRRLHDLGVGELASGHEQWRDKVRALMASADYRAEMGEKGRAVMATQTYEEHASRWLEAWTGKAA